MVQRVIGILADCGDGSASLRLYLNPDEEALNDIMDDDPETYFLNDGSFPLRLTFPDDFDLTSVGFPAYDSKWGWSKVDEE